MSSTVRSALNVLNCFSNQKIELSLSEIARTLNMNKSTLHHIVKTLRQEGVLVKTENDMYMLGMKLFEWGSLVSVRDQIVNLAIPYIHHLVNLSGETVHLGILHQDKVLVAAKSGTPSAIQISTKTGSTVPLHCTAMGKVILAHSSSHTVETILENELERYSSKTITSRAKLNLELRVIKKKGIATSDSEYVEGYYCMAALITDLYGKCFGSLSIGGPKQKILTNEVRLRRSLLSTVEIISNSISNSMSEYYLNRLEDY